MHITILALGSRGDIQPYAALGKGLKTAGHYVRFITFEGFAPLIEECDLEFHPIHGNPQALVAQTGANMFSLVRSFGSLAQSYARDLSASHLGETDLILNQLPAGLFGFDLAERYGVPMMLAAVIPLTKTTAFPLMGFPKLHLPGYNKLTYYLGEQFAWQMFRKVINRWRKQTLLLPALPLLGYFDQLGTGRIPVLNGFSKYVVPRPADWSEYVLMTGYWFPRDEPWQPPPDLQTFIESGNPPVFIGFGSMPVKEPLNTTLLIMAALRQTGQRGIIHAGWCGLGNLELPDYVFKIDYAPYNWLFPRMAMVIHHGGSGTTAAALRSGIPSCAIPFVFDQFYWGDCISRLGVGPKPIRYTQLTVDNLSDAIRLGVSDFQMRQNAAELGKQIRKENGIENAVRVIAHL